MRIVYFGTATFAVPPLQALLEDRERFDVVAVVTQPDKPAGRDAALSATPVAHAAREAGVTLLQPSKMKTDETQNVLAALNADVFVVAAYGRIIPKSLLDLPKHGCFNLHGSLLPKYRGASPIQAAIAEGETETGVTFMGMDAEVDHGPTYATVRVPIDAADTHATLETKLAHAGAKLLTDNLEAVVSGALKPVAQQHDRASFTSIIDRADGFVSWTASDAATVERRRRAFTPWPGIYAIWKRGNTPHRIKLLDVAITENPAGLTPGTVFKLADGFPAVAAKEGAVVLVQVQPEGKKPMDGKTMLNGHQDFIGTILETKETPA
jgi:methionyl-tRNA formyltransferase